jgi:hypothetical protein
MNTTATTPPALRPHPSAFALHGAPPTAQVIGNIEDFLKQTVAQLAPDRQRQRRGRPCILPALCLWIGLVVGVLRGFTSQADLWRLLAEHRLWDYPRFPVTDQAVYRRLETGASPPLADLFAAVTTALRDRLAPFALTRLAPFAAEVVALDQCHLDPVARSLPVLRSAKPGDDALLPGAFGALFDLRRQQWRTVQHHADPHQNEKVDARALVASLPQGSLVLADLGYFGFAWFDWLTAAGYHWVSRLRAKTSFTVRHVFYQDGETRDVLVDLGVWRADRAAHTVRLVQFRRGGTPYRYLTNVLDPVQLPLRQIAELYARRWDIELGFNLVKTYLGLHLLWSAKPAIILHQLWAVLTIAQVLLALRMEIAGRADVDPFEVSLPLLVKHAPQYAARGEDPVAAFVERGRAAHYLRPSRRVTVLAPDIPADQITPVPPGLVLLRVARYAGKQGR